MHQLQVHLQIVGMGDLLEGGAQQLLARIAQDAAQRRIDVAPVAFQRHDRHALRRGFECTGKALGGKLRSGLRLQFGGDVDRHRQVPGQALLRIVDDVETQAHAAQVAVLAHQCPEFFGQHIAGGGRSQLHVRGWRQGQRRHVPFEFGRQMEPHRACPQHLVGAVTEQALGAGIEQLEPPMRVERHDGHVLRGIHQCLQPRAFAGQCCGGILELGDVVHDAYRAQCRALLADHRIRIAEHAARRLVGGTNDQFGIAYVFATPGTQQRDFLGGQQAVAIGGVQIEMQRPLFRWQQARIGAMPLPGGVIELAQQAVGAAGHHPIRHGFQQHAQGLTLRLRVQAIAARFQLVDGLACEADQGLLAVLVEHARRGAERAQGAVGVAFAPDQRHPHVRAHTRRGDHQRVVDEAWVGFGIGDFHQLGAHHRMGAERNAARGAFQIGAAARLEPLAVGIQQRHHRHRRAADVCGQPRDVVEFDFGLGVQHPQPAHRVHAQGVVDGDRHGRQQDGHDVIDRRRLVRIGCPR